MNASTDTNVLFACLLTLSLARGYFALYLSKYSSHQKMFQMKVVDVKKIYSISCYALIPLYDEPLLRKSIISI